MNKTILSLAVVAAFVAASIDTRSADVIDPVVKTAKHGADDGANDRGNNGPGHTVILAKHGADDGADDRGNDGPGHTVVIA